MTEKRKTEVYIDGRNFTVVGSESEEYIKGLAKYVDSKIKDVSSKNARLCQTMSAILAALNIADELHNSNEELSQLESQSREPLEKYEDVTGELVEARKKIKELELQVMKNRDELLKSKMDNESVNREIKKYEQALEIKEKELSDSQRMIKSLQDKIFDNQIELIETKKELGEVVRELGHEKNVVVKEEV